MPRNPTMSIAFTEACRSLAATFIRAGGLPPRTLPKRATKPVRNILPGGRPAADRQLGETSLPKTPLSDAYGGFRGF